MYCFGVRPQIKWNRRNNLPVYRKDIGNITKYIGNITTDPLIKADRGYCCLLVPEIGFTAFNSF